MTDEEIKKKAYKSSGCDESASDEEKLLYRILHTLYRSNESGAISKELGIIEQGIVFDSRDRCRAAKTKISDFEAFMESVSGMLTKYVFAKKMGDSAEVITNAGIDIASSISNSHIFTSEEIDRITAFTQLPQDVSISAYAGQMPDGMTLEGCFAFASIRQYIWKNQAANNDSFEQQFRVVAQEVITLDSESAGLSKKLYDIKSLLTETGKDIKLLKASISPDMTEARWIIDRLVERLWEFQYIEYGLEKRLLVYCQKHNIPMKTAMDMACRMLLETHF